MRAQICSILSGQAGGRPNGFHGWAGRAAAAAAACVRVDSAIGGGRQFECSTLV